MFRPITAVKKKKKKNARKTNSLGDYESLKVSEFKILS